MILSLLSLSLSLSLSGTISVTQERSARKSVGRYRGLNMDKKRSGRMECGQG
jgi:hypothetical protein